MSCGGLSDVKDAIKEVQELCDQVRKAAESKTGKNYNQFIAKSYRTQVVAGTNFFIKVHVGGEEHIHLRVFRGLPCNDEEVRLSALQENKSEGDEIVYF